MNGTYLEAFRKHLREREDPASDYTVRSYTSKLRQFLAWLGERQIDSKALAEYRDHLRFEAVNSRGGRGQKPRTIKHAFTALAQWFEYLEEHAGVAGLPDPRKIKRPRVVRSDHGDHYVPTAEDVQQIYGAVESWPAFTVNERFVKARNLAILALAIECGVRRSELLSVDVSDLWIHRKPWVLVVRKAKGQQYREVHVNPRAQRYLTAYLEVRKEWEAAVPARAQNTALLPRDRSRRMDRRHLDELRHRVLQAAGLGTLRIRLHDFRHYRISEWGGVGGVNIATVAEMAGHADKATTLGYMHARESEKLLAVAMSDGGSLEPQQARRIRRKLTRRQPGQARTGVYSS